MFQHLGHSKMFSTCSDQETIALKNYCDHFGASLLQCTFSLFIVFSLSLANIFIAFEEERERERERKEANVDMGVCVCIQVRLGVHVFVIHRENERMRQICKTCSKQNSAKSHHYLSTLSPQKEYCSIKILFPSVFFDRILLQIFFGKKNFSANLFLKIAPRCTTA